MWFYACQKGHSERVAFYFVSKARDIMAVLRLRALATGLVLLALATAACGGDDKKPEVQATTPAPAKVAAVPAPAKVAAAPAPAKVVVETPTPTEVAAATPTPAKVRELVVMVHNAFDIGEDVIREFEEANNAKVVILVAGSSGDALVRAILEKGNPSADLLFGIDNTYLGRALKEEIFITYKSPLLDNVPAQFVLDDTYHVTPIDYGYVNINYDKAFMESNNLQPPATLEELTQQQWKGKLVVENPSTSSPGLAFLIVTISYFGEDDDYDYLDFWADLRANDVVVKDSWSDAYYTDFTKYGGDRPLVVSYATSPAAEIFFSEEDLSEPPTGNMLVDRGTFLQIEGIGILDGSDNVDLAQRFIDFALGKRFQEDFPDKMFVYPVNSQAQTPDFFRFAEVPTLPADIGPARIDEKREEWIDAWIKVVLR
uniref:Putative bacterial extracellular solute-binding protein n=1 Tax=uncultured marine microorganism HF4000_APKG8C21 TaxID=455553 RepID=B3TA33_9ZZZZ|nr:putative bacterial extracellular solute-binding protein [uncultured marine microorganism HF4000_APKG8C21]